MLIASRNALRDTLRVLLDPMAVPSVAQSSYTKVNHPSPDTIESAGIGISGKLISYKGEFNYESNGFVKNEISL